MGHLPRFCPRGEGTSASLRMGRACPLHMFHMRGADGNPGRPSAAGAGGRSGRVMVCKCCADARNAPGGGLPMLTDGLSGLRMARNCMSLRLRHQRGSFDGVNKKDKI
jgi:hypothetical protein